jgi:hypothetical protein
MPMSGIQKIFLSVILVITAQGVIANGTSAHLPLVTPSPWQFEIAPYLWAVNMNGTIKIGDVTSHVNQTFGDLLTHLNWGGMLWLSANKDKFGMFVNALYASSSINTSDDGLPIKAQSNFGIYSAGLSYQIYQTMLGTSSTQFSITPYAGARYTNNRASLTVNSPEGNFRTANDENWTDPIVGARLEFDFTKAWLVTLAGDIGGTNASSDYSYNLTGLLGFKPQTIWTSTTWYLGYRLLDQHYITGSGENYFNWNMKLFGPIAGLSFTF